MRANRASFLTSLKSMLFVACGLGVFHSGSAAAGTIDLKTAAPDYTVFGANGDDFTGQTVVFGDVNGDGRDDMIIGARGADYLGRSSCGAVYVVFSADTLHSPVELSLARGDVKRIYGPEANAQLGSRLACGDVNEDGRDDIVCGVPTASPSGKTSAGEVYVIYGKNAPPDTVDLQSPGLGVSVIQGENTFDKLGESVSVGDVNGDSFGDVVAGASLSTPLGRPMAGALFVLYGDPDFSLAQTIDLATYPWQGIRVFGSRTNDTFGTACLAADVTNDGIADILTGAPQAAALGRATAGVAYVIPGGASLPDTIDTLDGTSFPVVKILGATANALNGSAFGTADIDGDQVTDLLIASPGLSPGGRSGAGAVYMLNGAASRPDTIDLASPPAQTTRIDGPTTNLKIGRSLAAGDLNLDGIDDVVIGVPQATFLVPPESVSRSEAGVVYAIFGRAVLPTVIDLAAEQTGMTKILGPASGEKMGTSLAVGQLDTDGFDDLLIGANSASHNGSFSVGKAVVLLGNPGITPTFVLSFDAVAGPGRVRLEWTLHDDLDPGVIGIARADGADWADGRTLPASGLSRTGPGLYTYEDDEVMGGETYTYTVTARDPDAQTLFHVTVTVPAFAAAALHASVPNPFHDRTELAFDIPQAGRVALRVYDVRGALVISLADATYRAGTTTLSWEGRDDNGSLVPSGVYFARMEYSGRTLQRKLLLLR